MLAIDQIQDLPAIKRALPAFEMVLSKNKLYPPSLNDIAQTEETNHVDENIEIVSAHETSDFSQDVNGQVPFLDAEFEGFEFFDRWQMEQLDFTGIY